MTRNCSLGSGVNMHKLAADAATVNETIAESIRLNRKIDNICNYVGFAPMWQTKQSVMSDWSFCTIFHFCGFRCSSYLVGDLYLCCCYIAVASGKCFSNFIGRTENMLDWMNKQQLYVLIPRMLAHNLSNQSNWICSIVFYALFAADPISFYQLGNEIGEQISCNLNEGRDKFGWIFVY